jgi:F0F1-type ATP synthase assembly protein I
MDVQWEWLGVLVALVVAAAVFFTVVFGAPFFSVLRAFGAMAVVGIAIGWVLRHIAHFNPYDY